MDRNSLAKALTAPIPTANATFHRGKTFKRLSALSAAVAARSQTWPQNSWTPAGRELENSWMNIHVTRNRVIVESADSHVHLYIYLCLCRFMLKQAHQGSFWSLAWREPKSDIRGRTQLNHTTHGGATECRPPILTKHSYWLWPWISFSWFLQLKIPKTSWQVSITILRLWLHLIIALPSS